MNDKGVKAHEACIVACNACFLKDNDGPRYSYPPSDNDGPLYSYPPRKKPLSTGEVVAIVVAAVVVLILILCLCCWLCRRWNSKKREDADDGLRDLDKTDKTSLDESRGELDESHNAPTSPTSGV